MKIVRTLTELHARCDDARALGRMVCFVPTMGGLHDGHLALIRACRALPWTPPPPPALGTLEAKRCDATGPAAAQHLTAGTPSPARSTPESPATESPATESPAQARETIGNPEARPSHLVVASIFVNPMQFAPGEDLSSYPEDPARDEALCREAGVDLLFRPDKDEMYPKGFQTRVDVSTLGDTWEGQHRPGHFVGVGTVVLKLLHAVGPCDAMFGEKDAQQVQIIAQMMRDLHVPARLWTHPIIREEGGLAMSTRNQYLHRDERVRAQSIARGLQVAQTLWEKGERRHAELVKKARDIIEREVDALVYLAIVAPSTFTLPESDLLEADRPWLMIVAAKVGKARLIDNLALRPHETESPSGLSG